MNITFAHHLSLSYGAGGEKWVAQVANELDNRGHNVSIKCLPATLNGGTNHTPKLNKSVSYKEKWRHKITSDLTYVTYHPLASLNFKVPGPRIAGVHAHAYFRPLNIKYGFYPNLAAFIHKLIGSHELKGYDAIHIVTPAFTIHPDQIIIPNFVDSIKYRPTRPKNDVFTVGYASRKNWQKGYDIWENIKTTNPDMNFIETGGLSEDEMVDFYSECHVICVPSRIDTFGLTIVEAMMCDTDVICSGLPAHKVLGLPIFVAKTAHWFSLSLRGLKNVWSQEKDQTTRTNALKYDKKIIIDQIEKLFLEVANEHS